MGSERGGETGGRKRAGMAERGGESGAEVGGLYWWPRPETGKGKRKLSSPSRIWAIE